jgi:hypothetical protein
LEIIDHALLVSIDPASEDQQRKLKWGNIHQSEIRPVGLVDMRRNLRSNTRPST